MKITPTLLNKLKKIQLFDGLNQTDIKRMSEYFEEVSYGPHHYIFHEKTQGHTLYVIIEGHVKIEHSDARSGRRNTLAILSAGDCFGEIAIVSDMSRTAGAKAVETVALLVIEEENFLELVSNYPLIAKNLLKSMAKKLYSADRIIEGLIFKNLEARLASKLLDLSEKFGETHDDGRITITIALSHFDLAELIGTNRETVTRILSQLKKDECIATQRKKITVIDKKKLKGWVK
ncbi:MAG: Crp/Fnr family transcriptional regulator [Candidatus Lindowbacteria bacterium]|nr:Crp/Fnr family transcriptional regulator [Candidatus Lindowbacteria bacterium]